LTRRVQSFTYGHFSEVWPRSLFPGGRGLKIGYFYRRLWNQATAVRRFDRTGERIMWGGSAMDWNSVVELVKSIVLT
jgi:hypothetical protein